MLYISILYFFEAQPSYMLSQSIPVQYTGIPYPHIPEITIIDKEYFYGIESIIIPYNNTNVEQKWYLGLHTSSISCNTSIFIYTCEYINLNFQNYTSTSQIITVQRDYWKFIRVNYSNVDDDHPSKAIVITARTNKTAVYQLSFNFRYATIPTENFIYTPYHFIVNPDNQDYYYFYAQIQRTTDIKGNNSVNLWYIGIKHEDIVPVEFNFNFSIVEFKQYPTYPINEVISTGEWKFYLKRISLQKTNITITSISNGGAIPLIKYMTSELENTERYRCPTDEYGYTFDPENIPTNVPRGFICIGIKNTDPTNNWNFTTEVTLHEEQVQPPNDDILLRPFDLVALILSCIAFGLIVGGFIGWFAQRKRDRKNFRNENIYSM